MSYFASKTSESVYKMHFCESEGIENKKFLVTGGLGFVGSTLCLELIRRGARQVRAFDIRSESPWSEALRREGAHIIIGDISNKQDVYNALDGVDCIFHLASYGMSGKEMLRFGHVDNVNINGTCNVIDSCLERGVKRLVYVSTYNVIFGGQEIVNGDESLSYFPIDDHLDSYGRSKSIAEQLILKNNNRTLKNGKGKLYTCAIRPAAIYGPGEERHFPRIVKLAKLGLLLFKIGERNVKSDWLYVDNLVLALLLASMDLLDDIPGREGQPIASGQAYFISDGNPVNSFEFLEPLLKSLNYSMPKIILTVPHALLLAKFISMLYTFLYPWLIYNWIPEPWILPAEVHKVGITHYFSYLKAKEELGYRPIVSSHEGMASTLSYWKEKKRSTIDSPTIYVWLFSLIGMLMLFLTGFMPNFGTITFLRAFTVFFLRRIWIVRVVFLISAALHIGEAIYAWKLAKNVDSANAKAWFWQTLALGFFSLRYLLKRAKIER